MINQNRLDSMAAVGELEQCILSGQVSAAQLEAHRSAGELGGSATRVAIQLCMNQNRGVYKGMLEPLFAEQDAQVARLIADHDQAIESLRSELEAARDTLQFVERWANHHGAKPHMTSEQALGCIQHYPGIVKITRSYSNGKVPETRNPWSELDAARAAQLIEVAHLKGLLSRYRNELPVGHQPHMICHEVDAALFNTKEQSND